MNNIWHTFTGEEQKEKIWLKKDQSAMDIEIVAVADFAKIVTEQTKDLVPLAKDAEITLAENKKVHLYNFDFATKAKYTMFEAVNGITPLTKLKDPNENGNLVDYPKYSAYSPTEAVEPKVKNSDIEVYKNCKFTTLNSEIAIKDKADKYQIPLGSTMQLESEIIAGTTFINKGANIGDKSEIDDANVKWWSSDETKAAVDQNGLVTLTNKAKVGDSFAIFIKSTDRNNNGEIEKPFDKIEMSVVAKIIDPKAKFDLITAVDGGNGEISGGKTQLASGSQETIIFTPEKGYEIATVTVNKIDKTANVKKNQLIVTIDEDKTVVVQYKKIGSIVPSNPHDKPDPDAPFILIPDNPETLTPALIEDGKKITTLHDDVPKTGEVKAVNIYWAMLAVVLAGLAVISISNSISNSISKYRADTK